MKKEGIHVCKTNNSYEYLTNMVERTVFKRYEDLINMYILDAKNVIAIVQTANFGSVMIHYRLKNSRLIEISKIQICEYLGDVTIIKDLNLFMVEKAGYSYQKFVDVVYDYKEEKQIIEKGVFDAIGYDSSIITDTRIYPAQKYLLEHNCFLGRFTLRSKPDEKDNILYTNMLSKQIERYCFTLSEIYYALINLDGTIRGNKLFKGNDFFGIKEIIDLRDYPSLQFFKEKRVEELTVIKNQNIQKYYEEIEKSNKSTLSPYLDEEVVKVLSLER